MTDWQTDPGFLDVLWEIRGIKEGDEVQVLPVGGLWQPSDDVRATSVKLPWMEGQLRVNCPCRQAASGGECSGNLPVDRSHLVAWRPKQ